MLTMLQLSTYNEGSRHLMWLNGTSTMSSSYGVRSDLIDAPNEILTYINKVLIEKKFKIHSQHEYDKLRVLAEASTLYPERYKHLIPDVGRREVVGKAIYSILNGEPRTITKNGNEYLLVDKNDDLSWVSGLPYQYKLNVSLPTTDDGGIPISNIIGSVENRTLIYSLAGVDLDDFTSRFPETPIYSTSSTVPKLVCAVTQGSSDQVAIALMGMTPTHVHQMINDAYLERHYGKFAVTAGLRSTIRGIMCTV